MSHVEHHTLQPGNHISPITENQIRITLIELRCIKILLFDVESQFLGLRALYETAGSLQAGASSSSSSVRIMVDTSSRLTVPSFTIL